MSAVSTLPQPPVGRTITELPGGDRRRVDLTDHLHIPAVDGEMGAISLLLGLDGEFDEVRLAIGAQEQAGAVLDHAIEVLSACRAALERCPCGTTGPHEPMKYIGPGRDRIDSTVRTCPGDTEGVAAR